MRTAVRAAECTRAVLVGHNAFFDLNFLNAAVARSQIKRNPFHPFSSFDTATLGGVAFGQTVLMRATLAAGLEWDTAPRTPPPMTPSAPQICSAWYAINFRECSRRAAGAWRRWGRSRSSPGPSRKRGAPEP